MFKELNSVRTIKEGIRLEDLTFKKLKDFAGKTLYVDGFFFTNGDYGKQLVVVARDNEGGWKVNMPNRAIDQFEGIKANKEQLKGVLEGHLKIVDIREEKVGRGVTTLYTLDDC